MWEWGVNLSFTPSLLHHFTPLEAQCSMKRRKSFELHFTKSSPIAAPLVRRFTPLALAAQLLHQFTPSERITPYSYTVLPPLAAQLLSHFTPSGEITPSLLHHFTPPPSWQPNSYLILPLWTNNPLTITPFYPPWQPNSYLILPPLNKLSLTLTPFYPPWQPNS